MTSSLLTNYGAPELPEGFFYRVQIVTDILGEHLTVEIRKRRRLGSSFVVRKRFEYLSAGSPYYDIADVVNLAKLAHERFTDQCRDPFRDVYDFFGDHPDRASDSRG